MFADVLGYIPRQPFAVGLDGQQFGTTKAIFVDVFAEQCLQLAQCGIGGTVTTFCNFSEIQTAPYIDTDIYNQMEMDTAFFRALVNGDVFGKMAFQKIGTQ